MSLAFPKVKLNNPDILKVEVGLCCVPYDEVQRQRSLENVRLSCLRVIADSLPTLTTHQVQAGLGISSLKKEKRNYGPDNVNVFDPWFAIKKTLLLALSGLVVKPLSRHHSAKRFGQIPVTGAYYLRKGIWSSAIWRTGSEVILFHKGPVYYRLDGATDDKRKV